MPVTNSEEFARALKSQRYAEGLTQQQFTEKYGLKRHRLATFEVGHVVGCEAYDTLIGQFPQLTMTPPPRRTDRTTRPNIQPHVTRTKDDMVKALAREFINLRNELKLLRVAINEMAGKSGKKK